MENNTTERVTEFSRSEKIVRLKNRKSSDPTPIKIKNKVDLLALEEIVAGTNSQMQIVSQMPAPTRNQDEPRISNRKKLDS